MCLAYGGSDVTRTFYWLLQRAGFPYRDCQLSNRLDCQLLQHLKETFCHLDQVCFSLHSYWKLYIFCIFGSVRLPFCSSRLKGYFTPHWNFTHLLHTFISVEAQVTFSNQHGHSWVSWKGMNSHQLKSIVAKQMKTMSPNCLCDAIQVSAWYGMLGCWLEDYNGYFG